MTAIHIIGDHLELASIGTNTHAQIDTHIAAADDYVKRDGSLALTSDWDIGDTRKILTDEIRARDGAGLKLYDDAGNGIFVEDGGKVGVQTVTPLSTLHVAGSMRFVADGSYGSFIGQAYSSGASWHGVRFSSYRYRGTMAAKLAVINNDTIGTFDFIGGDGNTNSRAGQFMMQVDGTVSPGIVPGKMVIQTADSAGAQKDRIIAYANDNVIVGTNGGKFGLGATSPTAALDINSDILRLRTAKTPASASASGNTGDMAWDANYFYICIATNTWERTAHATW